MKRSSVVLFWLLITGSRILFNWKQISQIINVFKMNKNNSKDVVLVIKHHLHKPNKANSYYYYENQNLFLHFLGGAGSFQTFPV